MNITNSTEFILNNLPYAIVYFDSQGELRVYNTAMLELWNLKEANIPKDADIRIFFQLLREKQIYPETGDFTGFINNLYSYLEQSSFNISKRIYLNNGLCYQESIIKKDTHMLITWEDISSKIEATYNLNQYKNLHKRIVDNNLHPIIIIASTGEISKFNNKFIELFELSDSEIENAHHIRTLLNIIEHKSNIPEEQIQYALLSILNSKRFNLTLEGKYSNYYMFGFSLPDSSTFISFNNGQLKNDLSDFFNDQQAKDNLYSLQSGFIEDFAQIVAKPLATISGFCDLLANEHIGPLNERQKHYLSNISNQTNSMQSELEAKIKLSNINLENAQKTKINLDEAIAILMHNLNLVLTKKSIKVTVQMLPNINIYGYYDYFIQMLTLLLNYMIDQNNYNSNITLNINTTETLMYVMVQDSSRSILLSRQDLTTRYDINLALKLIELQNGSYDAKQSNKSQRELTIILDISNEIFADNNQAEIIN